MSGTPRKNPQCLAARGFETFWNLMKRYLGAGGRNRTGDLRVTSALLYRLSYTGVKGKIVRGRRETFQTKHGTGMKS